MKIETLAVGLGGAAVAAFLMWPRRASAAASSTGSPGMDATLGGSVFTSPMTPGAGDAATGGGLLDRFGVLLGSKVASDADAVRAGETGEQWAARIGAKYHGQAAANVPPTTVAAIKRWTTLVSQAIHTAGAPAYNATGIPGVFALPPPASQWQPPGFYWITRRTAGEYKADLDRAIDGWSHPDYVVIACEMKCQRDWGFLGTGIQLGTMLTVAGAAVGTIFGPAGTAAGGALGAGIGKVV